MTRTTLGILLMAGLTTSAMATEPAWEQSFAATCSPFLLDFECQAHLETMAELREGEARQAYLARHLALVEERRQSCACSMQHNEIGMLRH